MNRTIAAISTPTGESAIALVRVAGEGAVAVAEQVFSGRQSVFTFRSHTQHLGEIVDNGRVIDQVMLSVHRAPNSYTGEDLIEISCHGGALVTAKVLQVCLRAGARPARAGEFTERAYLNGKLDITQAEAVIDLIRAQTDLALRCATEQLAGKLGEQFRELRRQLIEILAHVDAGIDFPEEGISPDDTETIRQRIEELQRKITRLLETATTGQILREGLRTVIFGATNAGKSSLLNRMLGFDRAIVSETHGTTRDTIEERIDLRGIPLRLIDTAGFRAPENELERESMTRAERSLALADLRLHIADASAARAAEFVANDGEMLVLNKSDLPEHKDWTPTKAIRISCKTGAGIPELENAIYQQVGAARLNGESVLAVNVRHRDCLRRAELAITAALEDIAVGATPEMFSVHLRDASEAIDELLGGGDDEAVRDAIFSQFCIGK